MEVGAAGGSGQRDADELGCFSDGARVGVGVLLELLLVGREAVLGGELADLVEPLLAVLEWLVAVGEISEKRLDELGVEAAEPVVGGVGEWGEQLGEEEP